jgi:basic membrane protein A
VACLTFRRGDAAYLAGVLAAAMAAEDAPKSLTLGFVGGEDDGDLLWGYLQGARSVDPAVKVDRRFTGESDAETLTRAELAENGCPFVLAAADAEGCARAAAGSGGVCVAGVGVDWGRTLPPELAATVVTSCVKNAGGAVQWFFDRWDAGEAPWGAVTELGLAEGAVGLVTTGNYTRLACDAARRETEDAGMKLASGEVRLLSPDDPQAAALLKSAQP